MAFRGFCIWTLHIYIYSLVGVICSWVKSPVLSVYWRDICTLCPPVAPHGQAVCGPGLCKCDVTEVLLEALRVLELIWERDLWAVVQEHQWSHEPHGLSSGSRTWLVLRRDQKWCHQWSKRPKDTGLLICFKESSILCS